MLLNKIDSCPTKTYFIVAAAGKGSRMGAKINKQFLTLAGQPVIAHTIRRCSEFLSELPEEEIGGIVVVTAKTEIDFMQKTMDDYKLTTYLLGCIPGGASRRESVQFGLEYLRTKSCNAQDIVMIHDGARCLVSKQLLQSCRKTALEYGSACPGLAVTDTLRRTLAEDNGNTLLQETVARQNLYAMQTPQCFRFEAIHMAYQTIKEKIQEGLASKDTITDDVSVAQENGIEVFLVDGEARNMKLTRPEDLTYAEFLMSRF